MTVGTFIPDMQTYGGTQYVLITGVSTFFLAPFVSIFSYIRSISLCTRQQQFSE